MMNLFTKNLKKEKQRIFPLLFLSLSVFFLFSTLFSLHAEQHGTGTPRQPAALHPRHPNVHRIDCGKKMVEKDSREIAVIHSGSFLDQNGQCKAGISPTARNPYPFPNIESCNNALKSGQCNF